MQPFIRNVIEPIRNGFFWTPYIWSAPLGHYVEITPVSEHKTPEAATSAGLEWLGEDSNRPVDQSLQ